MRNLTRARVLVPVAALCAACFSTPAHAAATATWSCGADAVTTSLAGQDAVNPVTVSRTPCAGQNVGLPNTANALGAAPNATAQTAYAVTAANPAGARPLDQTVGAAAGVEGLSLQPSGAPITIGADAVTSQASASCVNGTPSLTGSSKAVNLTINGTPITADTVLQNVTNAITGSPLGAVVSVKLNEQVADAAGLTQRGAHIQVLSALGSAPLADVVIAESRVSSASACDASATGNAPGTGPGTSGGGTGPGAGPGTGSDSGAAGATALCPSGSQYDAAKKACVIPASATGGQGALVVGSAFGGPRGASVIGLVPARKKYKSPCLSGSGPKYAIVGTNAANRITGTNGADRILALGGNDQVDGGRGNDCIDGGSGSDNLTGGIGDDRIYGGTGNDHLNGGPGADRLSGQAGNDTINAGFGADKVFGGPGKDAINVATAGKPATVSCGTGRDTVRVNRNEVKRTTGCEKRYVLKD